MEASKAFNIIKSNLVKLINSRIFAVILLAFVFLSISNYIDQSLSLQNAKAVSTMHSYRHRFVDGLLFALPLFFIRKKILVYPYIILVYLYYMSNLLYIRFYETLMPMSSYLLFDNLDTLGPSIYASLKWSDLWTIVPVLLFVLYYWYATRKKVTKNKKSRVINAISALVCLCAIVGITLPSYVIYSNRDESHVDVLYTLEKLMAWRHYGFINYWIYSYKYSCGVSNEKIALCDSYMIDKIEESKNLHPIADAHDKNLIVIMVESFQSWPINLAFDSVEVTPYINRLVSDSSTIYFSKVMPQVKDGRSSDAQLLLNTGLFPINVGATACLFATNEFMALPKALRQKGYNCLALFPDSRSMWTQGTTAQSYGFEKIYDKQGFVNGKHTWSHMDENLFKNSLPKIKAAKEPFYAMLTTYSGHDVVNRGIVTPLLDVDIENEYIQNALNIYRYEDDQIGLFLESLKSAGLYDDSVIIITGDHDFVGYNVFENRAEVRLSDKYVPFIILNSPISLCHPNDADLIIGQCDIYPSILDIMGSDYPWRGLGKSVFREIDGYAVTTHGRVCAEGVSPAQIDELETQGKIDLDMSDAAIRSNFFHRIKGQGKP